MYLTLEGNLKPKSVEVNNQYSRNTISITRVCVLPLIQHTTSINSHCDWSANHSPANQITARNRCQVTSFTRLYPLTRLQLYSPPQSMEKYCVIEIIHFLKHLQENDMDGLLIAGNHESILQVLSDLEYEGFSPCFKNIIIASDNIMELINRYFWKTKLTIVEWLENVDEEYLIERVQRHIQLRMIIDFDPTLRRLNRIYKVIDTDSVVILKHQPPLWQQQYPMLFEAFRDNITNVINFEKYSSSQVEDNARYIGAKMALHSR